jgi:hypothetical protein
MEFLCNSDQALRWTAGAFAAPIAGGEVGEELALPTAPRSSDVIADAPVAQPSFAHP